MLKTAVALALLLTVLLSSGCVSGGFVIPVRAVAENTYGASPSAIKKGMTRAEIVGKFGEPVTKTADGRFLVYEYGGRTGFRVIEVYVDQPPKTTDNRALYNGQPPTQSRRS
jgi:hypothetical protein